MEIAIFIALMIVPLISIAALYLGLICMRRIANLKRLVATMARANDGNMAAVSDFAVSEI